jgi:hypothetical protein
MLFSNYKKTDHKPFGLMLETEPIPVEKVITPEYGFIAPNKIDHRDLCIPTDNQENTPHCTGYSTAGYIEIKHWQKKHFPQQYDATAIYKAAKKLDGFSGDGSWAKFTVEGAKNLGMIEGNFKHIRKNPIDLKFAILEYGACIGSFMITNEWNQVNKNTGQIRNFGHKANRLGGHAVLICGYDENGVYIQNSWGTAWGIWGFGWLSWEQFKKQFMGGVVIDDLVIL